MTPVFIGCSLLSLVIIHWQRVLQVPIDCRNVTVVWCVNDPFWMGGTSGGWEDLNGISQHSVSCGPGKDLFLAFAATLKPIRKA